MKLLTHSPGPPRARAASAAFLAVLFLSTGCLNHNDKALVFATSTKFGVDIAQRPDHVPEITLGYRRYEIASLPVGTNDARGVAEGNATDDVYSVIGRFFVSVDPQIHPLSTEGGVRIFQLFATGMAARQAATNEFMGAILADQASEIIESNTDASLE